LNAELIAEVPVFKDIRPILSVVIPFLDDNSWVLIEAEWIQASMVSALAGFSDGRWGTRT
jgi:hypothetical protein